MTPQYINRSLFSCIMIGRWAEDLGLNAKEICEVLSNNRGYYKEVFDYWLPMKNKIVSLHRQQNKNYMPNGSGADVKQLMQMLGSK